MRFTLLPFVCALVVWTRTYGPIAGASDIKSIGENGGSNKAEESKSDASSSPAEPIGQLSSKSSEIKDDTLKTSETRPYVNHNQGDDNYEHQVGGSSSVGGGGGYEQSGYQLNINHGHQQQVAYDQQQGGGDGYDQHQQQPQPQYGAALIIQDNYDQNSAAPGDVIGSHQQISYSTSQQGYDNQGVDNGQQGGPDPRGQQQISGVYDQQQQHGQAGQQISGGGGGGYEQQGVPDPRGQQIGTGYNDQQQGQIGQQVAGGYEHQQQGQVVTQQQGYEQVTAVGGHSSYDQGSDQGYSEVSNDGGQDGGYADGGEQEQGYSQGDGVDADDVGQGYDDVGGQGQEIGGGQGNYEQQSGGGGNGNGYESLKANGYEQVGNGYAAPVQNDYKTSTLIDSHAYNADGIEIHSKGSGYDTASFKLSGGIGGVTSYQGSHDGPQLDENGEDEGEAYKTQEVDRPLTDAYSKSNFKGSALLSPITTNYGGFRPVTATKSQYLSSPVPIQISLKSVDYTKSGGYNKPLVNDYNYNYKPSPIVYKAAKSLGGDSYRFSDSAYGEHLSKQKIYLLRKPSSLKISAGSFLDYGAGKPYKGNFYRKPYSTEYPSGKSNALTFDLSIRPQSAASSSYESSGPPIGGSYSGGGDAHSLDSYDSPASYGPSSLSGSYGGGHGGPSLGSPSYALGPPPPPPSHGHGGIGPLDSALHSLGLGGSKASYLPSTISIAGIKLRLKPSAVGSYGTSSLIGHVGSGHVGGTGIGALIGGGSGGGFSIPLLSGLGLGHGHGGPGYSRPSGPPSGPPPPPHPSLNYNSHGFGGYSLPDTDYLQSLFGFPIHDSPHKLSGYNSAADGLLATSGYSGTGGHGSSGGGGGGGGGYSASSIRLPQVIRAPFRTMVKALTSATSGFSG